MLRSQLFDHLQGVVFRAYCCYYLLCFFASSSCLFGMWLYVVCNIIFYILYWLYVVCNIIFYILYWLYVVCNIIFYILCCRQHTATYQINNLTTQTSRGGSNSTKHERRPSEDGQTIVTETCKVLLMCFTNIFNNLEF